MPSRDNDPNFGWTVQQGQGASPRVFKSYDTSAGQLLTAAMMPDQAAQTAAGINPAAWLANGKTTVVANLTPAAPVTSAPVITRVGPVGALASLTVASDMPPGSVVIDWGDGTTSDRPFPPYQAGHNYGIPGDYTVTMTATNRTGTDSETGSVLVDLLPTITTITPAYSPLAGGVTFTVTGTNFDFGGTGQSVFVGVTEVTNPTVVSATSLTFVSPSKTVGTYNVKVQTDGGISYEKVAAITYLVLPTLTNISANSGSTAGGTAVTLTGTGFTAGSTVATVKFGATTATSIVVVSATSITCAAPAHASGAVNVTVVTDGGTSVGTNTFTYS